MKEQDKTRIILILIIAAMFLSLVVGPVVAMILTMTNRSRLLDDAFHDLQSDSIQVAVGEVHSPSIIEVTRDYAYFLNFTRSHDIYKVYEIKASNGFLALLDQTYGLEYRPKYDVKSWWIW